MTRIINFPSRRTVEPTNRFIVEPIRWRVIDRVAGHEVFRVGSEDIARQFARRLEDTQAEFQQPSE